MHPVPDIQLGLEYNNKCNEASNRHIAKMHQVSKEIKLLDPLPNTANVLNDRITLTLEINHPSYITNNRLCLEFRKGMLLINQKLLFVPEEIAQVLLADYLIGTILT